MINLYEKLGEMNYDGLFSGAEPASMVDKRVIAKGSSAVTYARGTIMEKNSTDGKLYILGTNSSNTPDCVLCDDVTVGTDSDETVSVYIAGCFDTSKVTVKEDYTITDANLDALRCRNIILRDASAAI